MVRWWMMIGVVLAGVAGVSGCEWSGGGERADVGGGETLEQESVAGRGEAGWLLEVVRGAVSESGMAMQGVRYERFRGRFRGIEKGEEVRVTATADGWQAVYEFADELSASMRRMRLAGFDVSGMFVPGALRAELTFVYLGPVGDANEMPDKRAGDSQWETGPAGPVRGYGLPADVTPWLRHVWRVATEPEEEFRRVRVNALSGVFVYQGATREEMVEHADHVGVGQCRVASGENYYSLRGDGRAYTCRAVLQYGRRALPGSVGKDVGDESTSRGVRVLEAPRVAEWVMRPDARPFGVGKAGKTEHVRLVASDDAERIEAFDVPSGVRLRRVQGMRVTSPKVVARLPHRLLGFLRVPVEFEAEDGEVIRRVLRVEGADREGLGALKAAEDGSDEQSRGHLAVKTSRPGELVVNGHSTGVWVYGDGVSGQTEEDAYTAWESLPPGEYVAQVKFMDGPMSNPKKVEVRAGKDARVELGGMRRVWHRLAGKNEPEAAVSGESSGASRSDQRVDGEKRGKVTVYSKPKGEIVVNGEKRGQETPGTVEVEAGTHDVGVVLESGETGSKRMRIEGGWDVKAFFRGDDFGENGGTEGSAEAGVPGRGEGER
jgi:hypothetical protein